MVEQMLGSQALSAAEGELLDLARTAAPLRVLTVT